PEENLQERERFGRRGADERSRVLDRVPDGDAAQDDDRGRDLLLAESKRRPDQRHNAQVGERRPSVGGDDLFAEDDQAAAEEGRREARQLEGPPPPRRRSRIAP